MTNYNRRRYYTKTNELGNSRFIHEIIELRALVEIRDIELKVLEEERDRLRGSLASYEAELARVERELSNKNI